MTPQEQWAYSPVNLCFMERNVIPIPTWSRHAVKKWAASLRYVTAWANWRVAYGCWQVQMSQEDDPGAQVWGWGGGSTLGELLLARQTGFRAAMFASTDARLAQLEALGLEPIDRRDFADLDFDERLYKVDGAYRKRYLDAEERFLSTVRERTGGRGVSIFIDYIGTPVTRATVRALARQGVLTTNSHVYVPIYWLSYIYYPTLAQTKSGAASRRRSRTSILMLPSKTRAGRNRIRITSGVNQFGR